MSSGSSNQGGSSPNPNPNPGSKANSPQAERTQVRRRVSDPSPSIGSPNRSPGSILGVRGQTAFSAYNSPAGQSGPGGSSTVGSGYLARSGPIPAPPIPVGPTGIPTGTVIRLGGGAIASLPSAKKRVRDRGASVSAGSGSQLTAGGVGGGGGEVHACSLCPRTFSSTKALFGHMRCHPDRGWKGAHPPPTFNVEEEFGGLPGVNIAAVAAGGVVAEETVNDGEGGVGEADVTVDVMADEGGENVEEMVGGAVVVAAPKPFRGFDLNSSPPADD